MLHGDIAAAMGTVVRHNAFASKPSHPHDCQPGIAIHRVLLIPKTHCPEDLQFLLRTDQTWLGVGHQPMVATRVSIQATVFSGPEALMRLCNDYDALLSACLWLQSHV